MLLIDNDNEIISKKVAKTKMFIDKKSYTGTGMEYYYYKHYHASHAQNKDKISKATKT